MSRIGYLGVVTQEFARGNGWRLEDLEIEAGENFLPTKRRAPTIEHRIDYKRFQIASN